METFVYSQEVIESFENVEIWEKNSPRFTCQNVEWKFNKLTIVNFPNWADSIKTRNLKLQFYQKLQKLLSFNSLWITNTKRTIVVNFHQDFLTTTFCLRHRDRDLFYWSNHLIILGTWYSKTSFLVQIKFITEDSEQTHIQMLILN